MGWMGGWGAEWGVERALAMRLQPVTTKEMLAAEEGDCCVYHLLRMEPHLCLLLIFFPN